MVSWVGLSRAERRGRRCGVPFVCCAVTLCKLLSCNVLFTARKEKSDVRVKEKTSPPDILNTERCLQTSYRQYTEDKNAAPSQDPFLLPTKKEKKSQLWETSLVLTFRFSLPAFSLELQSKPSVKFKVLLPVSLFLIRGIIQTHSNRHAWSQIVTSR